MTKRVYPILLSAFVVIFGGMWIFTYQGHNTDQHICPQNEMCTTSQPVTAHSKGEKVNEPWVSATGIESETIHLLQTNKATLNDFTKYLRSETRNIRRISSNLTGINDIVNRVEQLSGEFINSLKVVNDLLQIQNDGVSRRTQRLRTITNEIQMKINYLQNDPSNCVPGKVLLCELTNLAGFASGIHDVMSCFVEAFYAGKRLVLDVSKWHYTPKREWSSLGFRPLSDTCEDGNLERTNVKLGPLGNDDTTRNKLMHLPRDIKEERLSLGVDPLPWWWGQFVGYIFRPNDRLWNYVEDIKKRINFSSPIVGIHVRRSDKILGEAKFHSKEEYMQEVEHYFNKLDMAHELSSLQSNSSARNVSGTSRNVFVATDDPEARKALKQKYPGYNFVLQDENVLLLARYQRTRYNNASLYGLLADLYLLADTEYLVCTLSSGFCRLAFALSNYLKSTGSSKTDSSEVLPSVYSLDVPLHYTYVLPPKRQVTLTHVGERPDELSAVVGDILNTTDPFYFENEAKWGKYEDGFSVWTNVRTGKTGSIPNFKTKEIY